jgi:hypothetical protein
MHRKHGLAMALKVSLALAALAAVTGCAGSRVYDPAYNDTHTWNHPGRSAVPAVGRWHP